MVSVGRNPVPQWREDTVDGQVRTYVATNAVDANLATFSNDNTDGQATVSGNTSVYRWIPFTTPVSTSQVRIVVTGAQNTFTRIAELTP